MLVLRRRADEAIVFEGGLVVTLVGVADHRAWLAFDAPSLPTRLVIACTQVDPLHACLAIKGPRSIERVGDAVHVELDAAEDSVLLVNRSIGEEVRLAGLDLVVSSLEQGRAVLTVSVAELSGPVGVSVFSVSGAEVKIGIAAPDDVRVYREEVWVAMRQANEGAATWSHDSLASLAKAPLVPASEPPAS